MKILSRVASYAPALLVLFASTAFGQAVTVMGVVQDASTSRPLNGVLVTLGTPPNARITRTDELGGFNFASVQKGAYSLSARGVGYIAFNESVTVDREVRLTIALTSVAALDTVRVREGAQAIYGVVVTADFTPLSNANVQFLGSSVGQTKTDSAGKFYYEVKTPGAYLVRGKSDAFGTATISVTVPPKNRVQVALILDTTLIVGANAIEMAYGDFRDRLMRRGQNSVLVPRSELVERNGGNRSVISALMTSRTFAAKGLRFSDRVCLFVDGIPQPGRSAFGIAAESVESVEAYGPTGDRSQTLSQRFPKSGNCGDSGMPRVNEIPNAPPRPDVIKWLVVWLKH